MKQLKFMLAAATAFGLASAQAATEELDNETFTYPDTQVVTEIDGFSFEGAEGDNESAIVNNALKVNTGTDPLLRQLNTKYGEAIDLTAEGLNSIVIDTKVQFTVTPEGDEVSATTGDKLMIYFKEDLSDVENPKTNLVVKALRFALESAPGLGDGIAEEITVDTGVGYPTIAPNTWYSLVVTSTAMNLGDGTYLPVFTVTVNDIPLTSGQISLANDLSFNKFPAITGPEGVPTLTKVGFAGEGMVDDFVVTKDFVQTSVDFTLALGTGVSAVTWTIDGVAQTNTLTGKVTAGQTIAITGVTYADWYGPTGTYVKDWSGVWGTDVTTDITVEAKELTTAGDIEVNNPTGADATTVSAALAWAKNTAKATTEAVKNADDIVANYLLNVTDLTVEPQIEIVSIDASTKPMTITAKVTDADGKIEEKVIIGDDPVTINGSIKYKAAATLEALKSATSKEAIGADDKFVQVVVE